MKRAKNSIRIDALLLFIDTPIYPSILMSKNLFIFFLIINSISIYSQDLNYIFKSGENGYNTFRIPSIVITNKGTTLAFAEGRKNSSSDSGDIDIVLKRSNDNGKTWGEIIIVRDDGINVCGNPSPVVDRKSGSIHLLSTWNLGGDTESEIINEISEDTRRVFVLKSNDDGLSWSKPKEITSSVKKDNWTWYATGPVHGIQISRGNYKDRLIIPCDHIESKTKKYFSHIIYSDDYGDTWEIGGSTPQDYVNESTVAEIEDGALMLNMRNYDRTQKVRKISISYDGGNSWGNIYGDEELIEPICQASLLRYSTRGKGDNIMMFLNPSDEKSRINMTLKVSKDLGKSWVNSKVLFSGPSAYSDMIVLKGGDIGCLFEAGIKSPYEGIVFQTIDFKDLLSF